MQDFGLDKVHAKWSLSLWNIIAIVLMIFGLYKGEWIKIIWHVLSIVIVVFKLNKFKTLFVVFILIEFVPFCVLFGNLGLNIRGVWKVFNILPAAIFVSEVHPHWILSFWNILSVILMILILVPLSLSLAQLNISHFIIWNNIVSVILMIFELKVKFTFNLWYDIIGIVDVITHLHEAV